MKIRDKIIKVLSTFFYVGYIPVIPGTFASIAALFLFSLIKNNLIIYTLFLLAAISVGFLVAGEAERIFKKKDASVIVIDEIAGMLLALAFLPHNPQLLIIALILFRALDVIKPYPAGDLQGLAGSAGIMGDDIVAGLYVNIILQFALRFASFKAS